MDFAEYSLALEGFEQAEVPEVDMRAARELLGKAIALESILDTITTKGAICRDQANYLHEHLPSAFADRYPSNSYTISPSKTNLSVTTEASLSQFFGSLGAFIKKVASMIIEVIKWVMETLLGWKRKNEQVGQVAANAAAIAKANEEVVEIIQRDAPLLVPERVIEKDHAADMDSPMGKLIASHKTFLENWTFMDDMILARAGFVTGFEQFGPMLQYYIESIDERVKVFTDAVVKVDHRETSDSQLALQARFAILEKSIPTQDAQRLMQSLDVEMNFRPGSDVPFSEVFRTLANDVEMMSKRPSTRLHPGSGVGHERIIDPLATALLDHEARFKPIFKQTDIEEKLLKNVIDDYKRTIDANGQRQYEAGIQDRYRTAMETLMDEIMGVQSLVKALDGMNTAVAVCVKKVSNYVFIYNQYLESILPMLSPDARAHSETLIKRARETMKKIG